METDYQARFAAYDGISPREAIIPMERPRDPNPPPMDFRTENKMAYKTFSAPAKVRPSKVNKYIIHKKIIIFRYFLTSFPGRVSHLFSGNEDLSLI